MEDADFQLVEEFCRARGAKYDRGDARVGGPPWDDGSDIAALMAMRVHVEPLIFNGGWPSVFYSRAGWAVPLAARAYRLLDMPECAVRCEHALRLVREAERANPEADFGSDEWLSSGLMQAISDEEWDGLDEGWFELTDRTIACFAAVIRRGL